MFQIRGNGAPPVKILRLFHAGTTKTIASALYRLHKLRTNLPQHLIYHFRNQFLNCLTHIRVHFTAHR